MVYRVQSGHDYCLDFRFDSNRSSDPGGIDRGESEVIECSITDSDVFEPVHQTLLEPIYEALEEVGLHSWSMWGQIDEFLNSIRGRNGAAELEAALEATSQNLVEVLLGGIVSLEMDERHRVQHAAIYHTHPWESPLRAAVLYHRDLRAFSRDFARIFLEAHCEVPSLTTFAHSEVLIWSLYQTIERCPAQTRSLSEHARAACWPSEPTASKRERVLRFFQAMDRQGAEQLSAIEGSEMLRLLQQAVSETPRAWLRPLGLGALIGIHPYSNLRSVYIRAAELSAVIPTFVATVPAVTPEEPEEPRRRHSTGDEKRKDDELIVARMTALLEGRQVENEDFPYPAMAAARFALERWDTFHDRTTLESPSRENQIDDLAIGIGAEFAPDIEDPVDEFGLISMVLGEMIERGPMLELHGSWWLPQLGWKILRERGFGDGIYLAVILESAEGYRVGYLFCTSLERPLGYWSQVHEELVPYGAKDKDEAFECFEQLCSELEAEFAPKSDKARDASD